jgi:hypothetical protein
MPAILVKNLMLVRLKPRFIRHFPWKKNLWAWKDKHFLNQENVSPWKKKHFSWKGNHFLNLENLFPWKEKLQPAKGNHLVNPKNGFL